MSGDRGSTDERMQLSEALWNLRCGIARVGGAQANAVSFGRMLTDPGYRARVIRSVRQSDSPELRRLAEETARHNVGGLAETPVSWDAAGRTELELGARHGERSPPLSGRPSVRASVIGASTMALLVSIVGGVLGYLFSPRVAAVLAGDHRVDGSITRDTTWSSQRTHRLTGKVFVEQGATLTIEPGTRIEGEPGSALVVTAKSSLRAQGERQAPIVMTSTQAAGERARGDWGGLVLLGKAPVNADDPHIEGIPIDDTRGHFGGTKSDDSCGVLEFVRVAHAGHELAANDELNGITLGGCGRRTLVRHVAVTDALDDGVEIFGGGVGLQYVYVAHAADDSLDWDLGWTGRAQFVVLRQGASAGDNAIEADNNRDDHDAKPRSAPTLANLTLLSPPDAEGQRRALLLRRGTAADLRNVLVAGFNGALLDVRDAATAGLAGADRLRLRGLLGHRIGPDGTTWARPEAGETDDDGGFDEGRFLRAGGQWLGRDPGLPASALGPGRPDFAPVPGGPASSGGVALPKGELWDRSARFIGAVRPGRMTSWLDGWTDRGSG